MKKTWMASALMAIPLTLASGQSFALEGGKTPLTVERLYSSPALAGASPRGLKLSPDGKRVTYLAGRKDNQYFYDLWQMDVATGQVSLLLDASSSKPVNFPMKRRPAASGSECMARGSWNTSGPTTVRHC